MKWGILFDLDGTLLNSLTDLTVGVNHGLAAFGLPPRTPMEIRSYLGNGARQLVALAMPGRENDPPVDEVLAAYRAYCKDHTRDFTKPYDGILEALEELKDIPMAVVSNKPDRETVSLCKAFFPDLLARGERPECPRKPAPDMLRKAMAQLGVDTCVYVGDSDVDVLTAKNTGVPCLSVLWGFRDKKCLEEAGGTDFCSDPRDLAKCLTQMVRRLDF